MSITTIFMFVVSIYLFQYNITFHLGQNMNGIVATHFFINNCHVGNSDPFVNGVQ